MANDYRQLVEALNDGVYCTDTNRVITFWNAAAERITGYSADEVMGHACFENILVHVDGEGRSLCKGLCPLAACMRDCGPREGEIYLHHKRGHRVPVWVRTSPLMDDSGAVIGGAEIFSDLSPWQAAILRVRELEALAMLDPLTKLSNRRHVEVQFEAMASERDRLGLGIGVMMFDVDHFKKVNDVHGHAAGDAALVVVSETLTSNIRAFDLIGRWGGEEFVGLFRNVTFEAMAKLAERFRMLVGHSHVHFGGETFHVTVSVGATLSLPGESLAELLARVDALLYRSKIDGRNRVSLG